MGCNRDAEDGGDHGEQRGQPYHPPGRTESEPRDYLQQAPTLSTDQLSGTYPESVWAAEVGQTPGVGRYPPVRIATIFRNVTQRFLNSDPYAQGHVDRRHQCRRHQS